MFSDLRNFWKKGEFYAVYNADTFLDGKRPCVIEFVVSWIFCFSYSCFVLFCCIVLVLILLFEEIEIGGG
jgi:hypothetical protein